MLPLGSQLSSLEGPARHTQGNVQSRSLAWQTPQRGSSPVPSARQRRHGSYTEGRPAGERGQSAEHSEGQEGGSR